MKQEPADKFIGGELQCFDRVVVSPVPVCKTDLIIIYGLYPVVGYGNTMGIAAKILKDLFRTSKGTFGIGKPFDLEKRLNKAVELPFGFMFYGQFIIQICFFKQSKIPFLKLF